MDQQRAFADERTDRWSLAGRRIAAGAFRRAAPRARTAGPGVVVQAWRGTAAPPEPEIRLPWREAAALVRSLSGRILRGRTAVEALYAWCDARGIGAGPIRAIRRAGPKPEAPGAAMAEALALAPDEEVECRQVVVVRGGTVLMEADNWLVPGRLLPPVRALLRGSSDLPFDAAIAPLEPTRRTTFLRFPHPALRETARAFLFGGRSCAPDETVTLPPSAVVLEVEAVVLDWRRRPLAVVAERYRAALLAGLAAAG